MQIASIIKLADLRSLNEGNYFGEGLYFSYLELLSNLNIVAIETSKKFGQLKNEDIPKWA